VLAQLGNDESTGSEVIKPVAEVSGVSEQSVYRALNALTERGLVDKTEPSGSRSNIYARTERGRETFETYQQFINDNGN
jgi:DNA-binding PadR family transcriptional regulator